MNSYMFKYMECVAFLSSFVNAENVQSGETNVVISPSNKKVGEEKSDWPIPYRRGCSQSVAVSVSTGVLLCLFRFRITPLPELLIGDPFHPGDGGVTSP